MCVVSPMTLLCPEDSISQQSSPASVSQHLSVPSSTMSPYGFMIQAPLVLYTLRSARLCTTHHAMHKTASQGRSESFTGLWGQG